jgi:hypothetical protein
MGIFRLHTVFEPIGFNNEKPKSIAYYSSGVSFFSFRGVC